MNKFNHNKLLFIVTIILFFTIFTSCDNEYIPALHIPISDIELTDEGLEFTLKPQYENIKHYNPIKIGYFIGDQKKTENLIESTSLSNDFYEIENLQKSSYIFKQEVFSKEFYSTDFLIRPFVIDDENNIHYANNSKKFSLYNLAKDNDNEISKLIVAIVEGRYIENIKVSVNFNKYTINSLDNRYSALIETDYDQITITIEVLENNILATYFKFIINGKEIEKSKYFLEDNTLIYKTDDPN